MAVTGLYFMSLSRYAVLTGQRSNPQSDVVRSEDLGATHSGTSKQASCSSLAGEYLHYRAAMLTPPYENSPSREVSFTTCFGLGLTGKRMVRKSTTTPVSIHFVFIITCRYHNISTERRTIIASSSPLALKRQISTSHQRFFSTSTSTLNRGRSQHQTRHCYQCQDLELQQYPTPTQRPQHPPPAAPHGAFL